MIGKGHGNGKALSPECPSKAEMVHPDSINDFYIETFLMIGKQKIYSSDIHFLPNDLPPTYR
jgi:hypothetical protein